MKPTIRIIHALARSGGTVICRCLGCMDGVALLSEVHPDMGHVFDPMEQAREWHGLCTLAEREASRDKPFAEVILELEQRARRAEKALVIRSWDHIDFMPSHFNRAPSYRSKLVEALRSFEILRVHVHRWPGPMWASLAKHDSMRADVEAGAFTPEEFKRGHAEFLREMTAENVPLVQYDDFVREPWIALRHVCHVLDVAVDPNWPSKWRKFRNVTGCIDNTKALGGEL